MLSAQNTAEGDGIIESGENPQEELAKAAQNPVADLISLPFQNNTNFGYGPDDEIQNVLNIQPVVPFHLSENWNLITRTIAPVICQSEVVEGSGDEFGLGDINLTAFFLRKAPPKASPGVPGRFSCCQQQRTKNWAAKMDLGGQLF
jgi:hypothetical protein